MYITFFACDPISSTSGDKSTARCAIKAGRCLFHSLGSAMWTTAGRPVNVLGHIVEATLCETAESPSPPAFKGLNSTVHPRYYSLVPAMSCLSTFSNQHSDAIDAALAGAKRTLDMLEPVLDAAPVPGLSPAASLLASVIEHIQVCTYRPYCVLRTIMFWADANITV